MTKEQSDIEGKKAKIQEGIKLTGSRNAKDRTYSLQGVKCQSQHCFVAILEWERKGHFWEAELGWGMDPQLAVCHATSLRFGPGASVCQETAYDTFLQTPC